jgi:hypothetical protein
MVDRAQLTDQRSPRVLSLATSKTGHAANHGIFSATAMRLKASESVRLARRSVRGAGILCETNAFAVLTAKACLTVGLHACIKRRQPNA